MQVFSPPKTTPTLPPSLLQLLDERLMHLLILRPLLLHASDTDDRPYSQRGCLERWPLVVERLIWRDAHFLQHTEVFLVAGR